MGLTSTVIVNEQVYESRNLGITASLSLLFDPSTLPRNMSGTPSIFQENEGTPSKSLPK